MPKRIPSKTAKANAKERNRRDIAYIYYDSLLKVVPAHFTQLELLHAELMSLMSSECRLPAGAVLKKLDEMRREFGRI